MIRMVETLKLSCGHTLTHERPYADRSATAGDLYRCPVCGERSEVREQVARSK